MLSFVHYVTQCILPPTALLLTSSDAGFYLMLKLEKCLMLVHLPFHNSQFQNGTWDLPHLNLVQIMDYRC